MYVVGLNGDTSIVPHLPYNLLPVLIQDELSRISKVVTPCIQDDDQVCYTCYTFFNLKLKSSECMLSNEDVVLAKKVQFETNISEFQYVTSESYVQLCLYTTALSTCELLVTHRAFLFPNVYTQFIESE